MGTRIGPLVLLLALGCSVGPDYHEPETKTAAAYDGAAVGEGMVTLLLPALRSIPITAASGHRPTWVAAIRALPTVRLPPNRHKRPRPKPSRRTAATKGAETPACQAPGRRPNAAALSPDDAT